MRQPRNMGEIAHIAQASGIVFVEGLRLIHYVTLEIPKPPQVLLDYLGIYKELANE